MTAWPRNQGISVRPLSGLLHQNKFLPLKVAPIAFEFELVGTPEEAVAYGDRVLGTNEVFSEDNASND